MMKSNSDDDSLIIVSIENIVRDNTANKIYIIGRRYKTLKNVYETPIRSGDVGEFLVSDEVSDHQSYAFEDVESKMLRVPMSSPFNSYFFISHASLPEKCNNVHNGKINSFMCIPLLVIYSLVTSV